ncbi:MAG: hypothetical protein AAF902_21165 [Chloroflexota bacterium]
MKSLSDKRAIIFAHARSGSTSLFHALNLHPKLNLMEEPFNENRAHWEPGYIDYRSLVHDIPSLDTQLERITTAHNGFKLLDYQLPEELLHHIFKDGSNRFIFLQRKNLLQAVVSVLIAHQNLLWQIWDAEKPVEEYFKQLKSLDPKDVHQRVTTLKQHLSDFKQSLDQLATGRVFDLSYEELYFTTHQKQQSLLNRIWHFLDLEPFFSADMEPHLSVDQAKINTIKNYAHLPNAAEINQICGSDETGWLF